MVRKTQAAVGGGRRAVSLGALKEGITFVRTNPILLSLMVLDFNATFFGNQRALFPVYARDILEVPAVWSGEETGAMVGAAGLGVMNSAVAIGALLGALIVNRLPGRDYAGRWVMILMTCFGLCTCGFAISTNFFLTLALLGGVGLTNSAATILRNTINQLVTPDKLRGRVLAVNHVFTSGGPQFGQFESGAVAATWGAEVSAFTGGLAAALIVPMLIFVRPIREFRMRRAESDASAAREEAGVR
ncbi:MAG: transporter, partial [Chloroflexi bacterium]|nr:transporter [Chloroflexota bacterium]